MEATMLVPRSARAYLSPPFRLAQRLTKVHCPLHESPSSVQSRHRQVVQTRSYQANVPWVSERSPMSETARDSNRDYDTKAQEALAAARGLLLPTREPTLPTSINDELSTLRPPRAAQLTYLTPLRRALRPHNAQKAAELQLRSYSVRNLEFMSDFALRAAYFLNIPAKGPFPLPRLVERWTVPRSNFVHKKSQENFERVTLRRNITLYDAAPETVAVWLGFVRKHAWYGVGFKANVFEHCGVEVGKDMDVLADEAMGGIQERLRLLGARKDLMEKIENKEFVDPARGAQTGRLGPMGESQFNKML